MAYERGLHDFAELLLLEKLGPRTLQSLALVAEVVHGAPSRFNDPARFSFAHGGKDGHPHPVPLKTYDESLHFLRNTLNAAKIGHTEKLDGFRRLEASCARLRSNSNQKQTSTRSFVTKMQSRRVSMVALFSTTSGVLLTHDRAHCSNFNTAFDFGALLLIFFRPPPKIAPTVRDADGVRYLHS